MGDAFILHWHWLSFLRDSHTNLAAVAVIFRRNDFTARARSCPRRLVAQMFAPPLTLCGAHVVAFSSSPPEITAGFSPGVRSHRHVRSRGTKYVREAGMEVGE